MSAISHLAMAHAGIFSVELHHFFYANFGRLQHFAASRERNAPFPVEDLKTLDALFTHFDTKVKEIIVRCVIKTKRNFFLCVYQFVEESIDCLSIRPSRCTTWTRRTCSLRRTSSRPRRSSGCSPACWSSALSSPSSLCRRPGERRSRTSSGSTRTGEVIGKMTRPPSNFFGAIFYVSILWQTSNRFLRSFCNICPFLRT